PQAARGGVRPGHALQRDGGLDRAQRPAQGADDEGSRRADAEGDPVDRGGQRGAAGAGAAQDRLSDRAIELLRDRRSETNDNPQGQTRSKVSGNTKSQRHEVLAGKRATLTLLVTWWLIPLSAFVVSRQGPLIYRCRSGNSSVAR